MSRAKPPLPILPLLLMVAIMYEWVCNKDKFVYQCVCHDVHTGFSLFPSTDAKATSEEMPEFLIRYSLSWFTSNFSTSEFCVYSLHTLYTNNP